MNALIFLKSCCGGFAIRMLNLRDKIVSICVCIFVFYFLYLQKHIILINLSINL